MAVTAKFLGDFSTFIRGVETATVELKQFDTEVNTINRSLKRMSDDFSGRKIIQEATLMANAVERIGGPARLTAAELTKVTTAAAAAADKMRLMGIDVPPKIQALANQAGSLPQIFGQITGSLGSVATAFGVAFGSAAVVSTMKNLVTGTLDYADALANMRDRTDFSLAGLQKLESIGTSAGVTMETMARAAKSLAQNLDDPKAVQAIKDLGLNFKEIIALDPETRFFELAKAVAKIEDPVKRANVGGALFKKTWDDVSAAFRGDIDSILKNTKLLSDSQIEAAAAIDDAWDQLVLNQSRRIKSFVIDTATALKGIDLASLVNPFAAAAASGKMGENLLQSTIPKVGGPSKPASALLGGGPSPVEADFEAVIKKSNEQLKIHTEELTKAAKAREAFAAMAKVGAGSMGEFQHQLDLAHFQMEKVAEVETRLIAMKDPLLSIVQGPQFKIPESSLETWTRLQTTVQELPPATLSLGKSIEILGESFAQMGQIAQGAMSSIARGVGTLISGAQMAFKSVDTLKLGFSHLGAGNILQGLAGVASGIGGIASAASAAIAVVKGLWNGLKKLFGGQPNDQRDAFFNQFGGLEGVNEAAFAAGDTDFKTTQAIFNAKTEKQLNEAIEDWLKLTGKGGNSITSGSMISPDFDFGGAMASGGRGRVHKPTWFLAGESGPEDWAFTPANGGGDGGGMLGKLVINIDGRPLAEVLVPYIPGAVKALVGTT